MDHTLFWTIIGTGVSVIGLVYATLRNFKTDVLNEINYKFDQMQIGLNARIDSLIVRIDSLDARIDTLEARINALGGKVAKMDARLIEVEKHLFAIRTIINYDPENFRNDKGTSWKDGV